MGWSKPRLLLPLPLFVLHVRLLLPPARSSIKECRCKGKEDQMLTTCWRNDLYEVPFLNENLPTSCTHTFSSERLLQRRLFREKKTNNHCLLSSASELAGACNSPPSLSSSAPLWLARLTHSFRPIRGPNQETFSGVRGIFFFSTAKWPFLGYCTYSIYFHRQDRVIF